MQKEIQGEQDDEESDQEQISSAQYIPHRGKSARPSVAPTPAQEEEKGVPHPLPADVTLRTPLTDTFEAGQGEAPANVEIALLSEDESQVLHGEIPISRKSSDQKDDESQVPPPPPPPSHPDVYSDTEYASDSYDSAVTEEDETTPTATPTAKSTFKDPSASSADRAATETQPPPIGAVELKPYNHQVGGHSTVYSFSRQAVCKQLNSKENEFYETVEQFHPELLDFLPRYVSSVLIFRSTRCGSCRPMLDETSPRIITNTPVSDTLVSSMSPTRNHPRRERPKLKILSPTHRKPPTLS